jgi:hypothetical protein
VWDNSDPLQLSHVTETKNALSTIGKDIQNVITVLKGLLQNEGQQ